MGNKGRKILYMSDIFFAMLFSEGEHNSFKIIKDGLPKDSKVIDAKMDKFSNEITFLIESEEFEVKKDDEKLEIINPIFSI